MQQHAERLAERVADEPDDAARIAEGVSTDLRPRADAGGDQGRRDVPAGRADASSTRSGAPTAKGRARQGRGREGRRRSRDAGRRQAAPPTAQRATPPADGMMAGVVPGAKPQPTTTKKMLPVTTVRPLHEDAAELERVPVRELTHHVTPISPPPVTRRDALCRIGNGFGMLAFASLVGESLVGRRAARPAQARAAATRPGLASPGARQARHLPVHERRAVAGRQLRSEADARQVPRPAAARRRRSRPSARPAR